MEILLNKMYTGSFTTTAYDIGHEIINFFKTDNGDNYVYILPYGGMGKEHNDKISHILFTGAQKDGKFEILAKVVGHEQIFRHGNKGNKITNAEQVRYIIDNNIKYGGKYLHEIMQHNTGNSEATYVSFKAQKIIRAKKPIVVDQSSAEFSEINLQRSKGFVYEGGLAYNTLVKMINDDSLWEEKDTTKTVDVSKYTKVDDTNFLQLIRKEHDETIFTNLFHYYLSQSSNLRDQFVKFLLNVKSDDYSVEREKVASDKEIKSDDEDKHRSMDRMDLWLEGKENIIIIENKIKSGINGSRHDVNGELVQSQLSAYYNYAVKKGKNVHCFIFAPNYNEVDTEKGLYMHNDKYKIIRYKDIYNFFNNPAFVDLFKDDPFGAYTQFVAALSMHIYRPEEEMEKRFVNMINAKTQSRLHTMTNAAKEFIESNCALIDLNEWDNFFEKASKENGIDKKINARELFHIFCEAEIPVLSYSKFARTEIEYKNVTVYTDDTNISNNGGKSISLEDLVDLMKHHHCYIDYRRDDNNKVKFLVLISKQLKSITDDNDLQEYFNICSKELYKKATRENANPLDLFFLLAYHTIDRIEFKPKEEMRKLVRESRNIENYTNNSDCENDKLEQDCPRSNAQNALEFSISERLGCYVDRSWKNVKIDADNHNIYLCKDYIEDYSKELEVLDPDFNYCRTLLLTFLHEFGHLAFSYLDYTTLYEGEGKTTHESRANFLPSYVLDGTIDMHIEQFVANQPKEYHNPLLYTKKDWEIDLAINEIYP